MTVPEVFLSTEAAKLWVTPTKLVPSTSTIRSFTWILQRRFSGFTEKLQKTDYGQMPDKTTNAKHLWAPFAAKKLKYLQKDKRDLSTQYYMMMDCFLPNIFDFFNLLNNNNCFLHVALCM